MKKFLLGLGLGAGLGVGLVIGEASAQINPPVTQCVTQALAGGTGDVITTAMLPCVPTTTLLLLTLSATNTTTTPTLQPVGTSPQVIVRGDGSALNVGELVAGATEILVNNGSEWKKLSGGGAGILTLFQGEGIVLTPNPVIGPTGTVADALFTSTTLGAAPASGGGTSNFLRADGSWAIPPGTADCSVSGAAGIVLNSGSNTCTTNTNITALGAQLRVGSSGNEGSIRFGASGGVGDLEPVVGTLPGGTTWQLPGVSSNFPIYSQFITYSGPTTARSVTLPDANFTAAALELANQTISGGFIITSDNLGTVSGGTLAVGCGNRDLQYFTNNGAFTLAADSNDGSCAYLMTNGASAGAVTLSGFTLVGGVCDGATLDTTNGHKFKFYFTRINGTSDCAVKAYQ